MTPEEKAMTEKSMMAGGSGGTAENIPLKDLPSSSIDTAGATVQAANQTAGSGDAALASSSVNPQVSAPSAPTTPSPSLAPMPSTTLTDAPKKKLFGLPWFHKKDRVTVPEMAQPASQEAEQLTNEALAVMIDEKLAKMNGDEFVSIKVNKVGAFAILGILLLLLWLIPVVVNQVPYLTNKKQALLIAVHLATPEPTITPTAPTPPPITAAAIRVRMGSNMLEDASTIKGILNEAGFKNIDLVYDPQVNPKLVMVVTKPGNDELHQRLVSLFEGTYAVASEAAELTSDSDYMATILVGSSSEK